MTTDLKLIKKRKKKNIIREIYLGDYVVVKRFIKTSIFPDMRRIWRYEDQSLRRLFTDFIKAGMKGSPCSNNNLQSSRVINDKGDKDKGNGKQ
jgi:hypothetical protein